MRKLKGLFVLLLAIMFIPMMVSAKGADLVIDMAASDEFDEVFDTGEKYSALFCLVDEEKLFTDDEEEFFNAEGKKLFEIDWDNGKITLSSGLTTEDNIFYTLTDEIKDYGFDLYDRFVLILSDVVPEKTNEVYISSLRLEDQSDDVLINSVALPNGLNIDVDVRFKNVGDYVKYKVVVKNATNKDYKIDDKTRFGASEYIKY